jgi:hypothetical protein
MSDYYQMNMYQDDLAEGRHFQAAGASKRVLAKVSEANAVCLRGFRFDVVKETKPVPIGDLLDGPAQFLGLSDHYPFTGELIHDVYLRTVTADYGPFSDRIPENFRDWVYPAHERWKVRAIPTNKSPRKFGRK